jgi:hypothetical protein
VKSALQNHKLTVILFLLVFTILHSYPLRPGARAAALTAAPLNAARRYQMRSVQLLVALRQLTVRGTDPRS